MHDCSCCAEDVCHEALEGMVGTNILPALAARRFPPPAEASCDQEVNERTDVAPRKVREEVSNKETRNQCEPCDAQVSLPGRADE